MTWIKQPDIEDANRIKEEEVKEGEKTWLKLACYGHSKPWLFIMMIAGLPYYGTRSKGPGSGGTFSGLFKFLGVAGAFNDIHSIILRSDLTQLGLAEWRAENGYLHLVDCPSTWREAMDFRFHVVSPFHLVPVNSCQSSNLDMYYNDRPKEPFGVLFY